MTGDQMHEDDYIPYDHGDRYYRGGASSQQEKSLRETKYSSADLKAIEASLRLDPYGDPVHSRREELVRIFEVNPELARKLAPFMDDGLEFDRQFHAALKGQSREVDSAKGISLDAAMNRLGRLGKDYAINDTVRQRASRDTVVMRLTDSKGHNYRFWWWEHFDDKLTGTEFYLIQEPREITAYVMAGYDSRDSILARVNALHLSK